MNSRLDKRRPPRLPQELLDALEHLTQSQRLLVAMDFDGTLAPIASRPEEARALPESSKSFAELAALPYTTTAFISGRSLSSLLQVASPDPRALLVGSHGAEICFDQRGHQPLALNDKLQQRLSESIALLQRIVDRHPGTTLEVKPAGVVLHTRQANDTVAEHAVAETFHVFRDSSLYIQQGKRVLECALFPVDKGQSLETLRAHTNATAVLFAGDDITDESAFRVLNPTDIGIKCGENGETAAKFHLPTVEHIALLLHHLLQLRSASVASS